MSIEWRKDLEMGVDEIDSQHKELFRRFDGLLSACNKGQGKVEIVGLLKFLADYVESHFRSEEKLQLKHAYYDYPVHREAHEQFTANLNRLLDEFNHDGASIALVIDTNKMLMAWLINHISIMDRQLGDYIKARSAD